MFGFNSGDEHCGAGIRCAHHPPTGSRTGKRGVCADGGRVGCLPLLAGCPELMHLCWGKGGEPIPRNRFGECPNSASRTPPDHTLLRGSSHRWL